MSAPVTPNEFKEAIPGPSGNFCEKFIQALNLPRLVYLLVNWMFKEDGTISDLFAAEICALECMGGDGTTPGGFAAPTNVAASDGAYSDKVRVTWSAVTDATIYDVYRGPSNSSSSAVLIGSTASTQYDDSTAESGETYYYWVRARNATQVSGYSNSDSGYRSGIITAISDLTASKGFSGGTDPTISLVFSPPTGADTYDFYWSDTDDFTTASLFDADRVPFDNSTSIAFKPPGSTKEVFIDNATDLTYIWHPPASANHFTKKYFWVIAKQTNGGQTIAVSAESNSAEGWAIGNGSGVIPNDSASISSGTSISISAGITRAWCRLYGSGGGGAGGNAADGGGGGGGGASLVGWISVTSAGKFRVSSTPEADTGNAAANANGADGAATVLEYSADGSFTDTIVVLSANAPTGGKAPASGGLGGTGASGSVHASVQDSVIYDGNDGLPASSEKGGRSGHRFGNVRTPPAHFNGPTGWAGNGLTTGSGGGTYATPGSPAAATGGGGYRGSAHIVFYAA